MLFKIIILQVQMKINKNNNFITRLSVNKKKKAKDEK